MPILNINVDTAGQAGQLPKFVYINTNDTIAEVTTVGYLNGIVAQNIPLSEMDMALVVTKVTPNSKSAQVALFDIAKSGDNWSLVASSGTLSLGNGLIFVGNASGVAVGVAMSGAATISNTGVITLAAGAVALSNLAAGITPSHIVKYAGTQANGGGSATVTITVTGMLVSDLPFVDIQASANAVNVQKVTPTANTITVLLSGDPGAGTVLSYQVLRAAV